MPRGPERIPGVSHCFGGIPPSPLAPPGSSAQWATVSLCRPSERVDVRGSRRGGWNSNFYQSMDEALRNIFLISSPPGFHRSGASRSYKTEIRSALSKHSPEPGQCDLISRMKRKLREKHVSLCSRHEAAEMFFTVVFLIANMQRSKLKSTEKLRKPREAKNILQYSFEVRSPFFNSVYQ